jgi:threonine/homoserine/homoserine lactone efflux protein
VLDALGIHDPWLFAATVLVLNATPGVDMMLTLARTLQFGVRGGLASAFGACAGCVLHTLAAAFGLAALMAASSAAFTVVKWAGAAYLAWLALGMARAAWRGEAPASPAAAATPSARALFRQGMLTNALNPKVALFFLTFVPQFLPDSGPTLPVALALSAIFAAVYLAWFTGMIALVGLASDALRRPRVKAWTERVTGAALFAFGVRLAAAGRH